MKNWKELVTLALPIMFGMVLQSLQGTADMMFVSWLGTDFVAGVTYGNNIFGTCFMATTLITAGTISLLTRYFGKNDSENIKKVSGQSISLAIIIGLVLGLLISSNSWWIVKSLFNGSNVVTGLGSEYTRIITGFIVIVLFNSTLQTILQARGDTRTPLYIFGLGNVINIVLDPIMIFTFGFGVQGAAWATVISRAISGGLILMIVINRVYDGKVLNLLHYMRLSISGSLQILRIGVWSCFQGIARPLTGMIMFRFVTENGGSIGTAAFGIGGQLFNYTFIVLNGLSMAISIKVGHKIGQDRVDEIDAIVKTGLWIAFINMLVFIIPYVFLGEYIFQIFKSDTEVVKVGVEYLRVVYVGVIFVIYPMIFGGVFRGAGDTFPPMVSSMVANVVFKLVISYTLAYTFGMGLLGIWIGIALSVIFEAIFISYYYKKGTWRTKEI